MAGGVRDRYVCSFPRRRDSAGDWFDPGHADNVVWRVPPRGYPPNVDLSPTLRAVLACCIASQ